jgi:ribosomal protein S18 acetylase RimI-like enzyme
VSRSESCRPVPGLTLRSALPPDALCLSVLALQVFLDTYATTGIRPSLAREVLSEYSQDRFSAAMASAETCIVVAEVDAHLVGFAQIMLASSHDLAPPGVQAELLRLYVQERFTGAQVGTRLLAEAERIAVASGATVMWLKTWVHNHRALAFYLRRGYSDRGRTLFTFEGESHENRLYAKQLDATAHGRDMR